MRVGSLSDLGIGEVGNALDGRGASGIFISTSSISTAFCEDKK